MAKEKIYKEGTPEAQIESLTQKIKELSGHLKENKKDFSSRRGLLQMVSKRRRLLSYLKTKNEETYGELLLKTKLKKK